MLREWYGKHFKSKLFNKILAVYTLVIILILAALAVIIANGYSSTARADAVTLNSQVLKNIENYLALKQNILNIALQQLYVDKESSRNVLYFIEHGVNSGDAGYYDYFFKVENYLKWISSLDSDIRDILIVRNSDGMIFDYIPRYGMNSVGVSDYGVLGDGNFDDRYRGVQAFGSFRHNYPDMENELVYTLGMNIWDSTVLHNVGRIYINFSAGGMLRAYAQYKGKLKGDLFVFTKTGSVMYSSSGEYYDTGYPYFDEVKKQNPIQRHEETSYVNTLMPGKLEAIICGIIPESELSSSTLPVRAAVYTAILVCVALLLLITYTITSVFSRRLRIIVNSISKASVDLASRINVETGTDEIGLIAQSFNGMCDRLQDYIQREYVLELRRKDAELNQRSAELYALQSQVNPHFLYNTLEVIRMTAVAERNENVGEMIHTLANLLRSSLSSETVESIGEEMEYCKSYLELCGIRYADKLEAVFDVGRDVCEYGIFRHLVQPLIENAILHGIDPGIDSNVISVTGRLENGSIHIRVADNGRGMAERKLKEVRETLKSENTYQKDRIGLINVNHRLKLIYGAEYGLSVDSAEGGGTAVTISMPAKSVKELKDYVQIADR